MLAGTATNTKVVPANDYQLVTENNQPTDPAPASHSFSLIVGGDLMFDRHLRTKAERIGNYDFIFAPELTAFLNSADYALANLEGPITLEPSISQYSAIGGPGNYTFTFSPAITTVLKNNNLKILNLGNNHILNFGPAGLESTYQYLDAAQLLYFGDIGTDVAKQRFYMMQVVDEQIALLSYNQFAPGAKSRTLQDIAVAQKQGASLILLFCHWGNEYVPVANQTLVDLAHQFIDQGVDLIIGGHPHVVQNQEIYQDKTIYYSLGNFVFDQYFSPETQEGLLLKINFTYHADSKDWTYQIDEQKIYLNQDGVTSFNKTKLD